MKEEENCTNLQQNDLENSTELKCDSCIQKIIIMVSLFLCRSVNKKYFRSNKNLQML